MQNQSWVVTKPGSLKNLVLREGVTGKPEHNQLTVKVKAVGLNYADVFSILGLYKAAPKKDFIPGLEFAGEVISAGPEVTRFKKGDRVMGVTRFGAYTTALNVDERYCDPLPVHWSFEEAASFPVQVLTAWYALVTLGGLRHGQSVLIHSAAGGVGLLANRIARKLGAFTIGVVGSENKISLLLKEGYDRVVVRTGNFKEQVKKALETRELNLVLETTGGKYMRQSYELLGPMGKMVCYGSAQFTPSGDRPNYLTLLWKYLFRPKFDPLTMITENKSILAFNLIWLYERVELMRTLMAEIGELKLPPPYIGHRYAFEELPEAIRFFRTGKSMGKIVLLTE